jgi:hypothetical protein
MKTSVALAGNGKYKRWQGSSNPEMKRNAQCPACVLYIVGRSFL